MPVKKKKTLSKAKKEAWEWFSKYIRLRDCLITMGSKEQGKCITCGRVYPLKSLQAGHFLAGRTNAILFEETNCHAQCYGCNVMKGGEQYEYGLRMVDMYGQEEIDRLRALKKTTREFTVEELEAIKEEYKDLYQEALKNN